MIHHSTLRIFLAGLSLGLAALSGCSRPEDEAPIETGRSSAAAGESLEEVPKSDPESIEDEGVEQTVFLTSLTPSNTRFRLCVPEDADYSDGIVLGGKTVWFRGGHAFAATEKHQSRDLDLEQARLASETFQVPLVRRPPLPFTLESYWEPTDPCPVLGSEVTLEFTLRNRGGVPIGVTVWGESCDDSPPDFNFACTVTRDGEAIPEKPPWRDGGTAFRLPIAPGESHSLTLCPSRRYHFDLPGVYTIEATFYLDIRVDREHLTVPPGACASAYEEIQQKTTSVVQVEVVP